MEWVPETDGERLQPGAKGEELVSPQLSGAEVQTEQGDEHRTRRQDEYPLPVPTTRVGSFLGDL
jgi:hypothetical protein